MGHLFQDFSRWRRRIPIALFTLVSCAVPLVAREMLPAKPLPDGAARAEAPFGAQKLSAGQQGPGSGTLPRASDPTRSPSSRTSSQQPEPVPLEGENSPLVLTRKQKQEALKSDFEKMKRDAEELLKLARSLQEDLDKSNENVLSIGIVEKSKQIESLAKKILSMARKY
jgi:hypothetical protein